jgi:hypothetical protein
MISSSDSVSRTMNESVKHRGASSRKNSRNTSYSAVMKSPSEAVSKIKGSGNGSGRAICSPVSRRMTDQLAPLSNKQTVEVRPRLPTSVQGSSSRDMIKVP